MASFNAVLMHIKFLRRKNMLIVSSVNVSICTYAFSSVVWWAKYRVDLGAHESDTCSGASIHLSTQIGM